MNQEDWAKLLEQSDPFHPLGGQQVPLVDLYKQLDKSDSLEPQPVAEKREKLGREYVAGIRSHALSLGDAYDRGKSDACATQHQSMGAWLEFSVNGVDQLGKYPVIADSRSRLQLAGKLPKKRQQVRRDTRPQPKVSSDARNRYSQLGSIKPKKITYRIGGLSGDRASANNRAAYVAYIGGKVGDKKISTGQRAIAYSMAGTPLVGADAIAQRGTVSASASQYATENAPTTAIPTTIKETPKRDIKTLPNQSTKVPVATPNDTLGNAAKLALLGAVITGVMLLIQYVISLIAFILQVTQLMATVTNIGRTVLTMVDNIMVVFGIKDGTKPVGTFLEGMLGNAFGKENAEYIKYNFAKCVSVFSAGANILNLTQSATAQMAEGVDNTNQNVGKIGNAMKRAGMISNSIAWFNERVAIASSKGLLARANQKAGVAFQVTQDLEDITGQLKSVKEQDDEGQKQLKEKITKIKEGQEKTDKENSPKEVKTPDIKPGDL